MDNKGIISLIILTVVVFVFVIIGNALEVIKMPMCRRCYSRDLIKYGHYKNRQRYKCLNCGKTTSNPRQRKPRVKQKTEE